jgi:hypothetical protein
MQGQQVHDEISRWLTETCIEIKKVHGNVVVKPTFLLAGSRSARGDTGDDRSRSRWKRQPGRVCTVPFHCWRHRIRCISRMIGPQTAQKICGQRLKLVFEHNSQLPNLLGLLFIDELDSNSLEINSILRFAPGYMNSPGYGTIWRHSSAVLNVSLVDLSH